MRGRSETEIERERDAVDQEERALAKRERRAEISYPMGAEALSPAELAAISPMRSEGHWHQASRTERDGVVIEVYEGPTWHPTPKEAS